MTEKKKLWGGGILLAAFTFLLVAFFSACSSGGGGGGGGGESQNVPEPEEEFTITLDANGGSFKGGTGDPTPTIEVKASAQNPLDLQKLSPKPTKTGSSLYGWALADDAIEADCVKSPYTPTKDVTLYAVWGELRYTVTFDALSSGKIIADGKELDQTHQVNVKVGGSITSFPEAKKEGYEFLGWASSSNAIEADINVPYTPTKDATLFAVYEKIKTVKVTLDANEGTIAAGAQKEYEVQAGKVLDLSGVTATKQGSTFAGWSQEKDAETGSENYTPSGEKDAVTLYAVWISGDAVTITLNYNYGDKPETEKVTAKKDSSISLKGEKEMPLREGYTFLGWATTATAEAPNVSLDNDGKYKAAADATLYAVWQKISLGEITITIPEGEPFELTEEKGTFTVSAKEGLAIEAQSYEWYVGGTKQSETSESFTIKADAPGKYQVSVIVTAANGGKYSLSATYEKTAQAN